MISFTVSWSWWRGRAPLAFGGMVTTVRAQGRDRTMLDSGHCKKAYSFLNSVLSGISFLELLQRY